MIYIVEVLARMLTLAASRLSMIALEKETERSGAWMETEGADTEREERKIKHKPPAVYQLQHDWALHYGAGKGLKSQNKIVNFAFSCCSADTVVYHQLSRAPSL